MATNKEIGKILTDKAIEQYQWSPVNWRAWGSWWGWGTPTGLGLFFVLAAFATWIFFHL